MTSLAESAGRSQIARSASGISTATACDARAARKILPFGDALYWEGIDEDLDVPGFLIGAKARDAKPPIYG
jgi:hypothetical protein